MLFSSQRRARPGPKGQAQEVIDAVVEMKRRNPTWGCPRIAQQIALAFGVDIDKDVVRRILGKHYKPESGSGGPSWLTVLGQAKDIHDKDLSRENTHLLGLIGRISHEATVAGSTVLHGFATLDPLKIGPTHQRDQTSICGNSITPSTKIEFE